MSFASAINELKQQAALGPWCLACHRYIEQFCAKHDIKADDLLDWTNYPADVTPTIKMERIEMPRDDGSVRGHMQLTAELVCESLQIEISYNPPVEATRFPAYACTPAQSKQ